MKTRRTAAPSDGVVTLPRVGYRTPMKPAISSLALAVLRGALLDLLATDDAERTTAAVDRAVAVIGYSS